MGWRPAPHDRCTGDRSGYQYISKACAEFAGQPHDGFKMRSEYSDRRASSYGAISRLHRLDSEIFMKQEFDVRGESVFRVLGCHLEGGPGVAHPLRRLTYDESIDQRGGDPGVTKTTYRVYQFPKAATQNGHASTSKPAIYTRRPARLTSLQAPGVLTLFHLSAGVCAPRASAWHDRGDHHTLLLIEEMDIPESRHRNTRHIFHGEDTHKRTFD